MTRKRHRRKPYAQRSRTLLEKLQPKECLLTALKIPTDLILTKPTADLAACAYKSATAISIKVLAWNTNLGWMSFEGASYSTLIFTDSERRVRGEAYGTNIGYIHMGCENGNNFSSSLDCTTSTGIKDYGVKVALADDEISGESDGKCGQ